MSAATSPRNSHRKDSDRVSYKMGAVKIYKETLVSIRNDGYVYPARSGTSTDTFAGVAYETVDNSAGSAGDKSILIHKTGLYRFAKSSAAITDLGVSFYASDDSTVTSTSTNNQFVGKGAELIDSTTLAVRIDLAAA